jgi:hypothetical protein
LKEAALLFGAGKSLVGVITDPPSDVQAGERPAVVLLNAGLLHRVGPNRLYVKLARRLAASGFVVVRFDLSGIGDSRAVGERSTFSQRAVAETRTCMDLLAASRGARRFIVGGLCSGADNALLAAGEDARIVGALLIEPVSDAPSAGQLLESYRARLLRPSSWLRFLTGRSEAWSALAELMSARRARSRAVGIRGSRPVEPAAAAPPAPESQPSGGQMRRFLERGGALCLVYSAGNPGHYHYRRVLRRELMGVPTSLLRVEVVEEADHVFTPLEAQARLVNAVCGWAEAVAGRISQ